MAEALAAPAKGAARRDGRSAARRGPETRDAIQEAALELFAKLGYHATSMRAIATSAQVQPAAIYHWYASKEAILVQLQDDFMDRLTERLLEAAGRHDRPALQLAAAVREHVIFHGNHSRAAFVTDSEIRALAPGPRRALVAQRDAYQERFADWIRAGMADGSLSATHPDVATYAILLQCTGAALWFDPRGPLSVEEVAEAYVELVLGSLQAGPELIAEAVKATR